MLLPASGCIWNTSPILLNSSKLVSKATRARNFSSGTKFQEQLETTSDSSASVSECNRWQVLSFASNLQQRGLSKMTADYGFNALPVQRILIFVKKLSIANTELKVMLSFTYTCTGMLLIFIMAAW